MDNDLKDQYRAAYRQVLPNWTDEQIDKAIEEKEQKRKTVLTGADVIHLDYFGGLLDAAEVVALEEMLAPAGIRLSRYDKTGDVHASLRDFSLQVSLMLKDPIAQSIVGGIAVNGIWAAIKKSTLFIWHRIRNNPAQLAAPQTTLNFGLHIQVNEKTTVDLKLDGNFTEQTVIAAMDKIPALLKEQGEHFKPEDINFLVFDPDSSTWYKVDAMAQFRALAEEQSKRRNSANP